MAYTYDDFVNAATGAGLLNKFSAEDIETTKKSPEFGLSILSLMQDENNAATPEAKLLAREAANQLRQNYGSYMLNADGSTSFAGTAGQTAKELADQIKNYGSFTYGNEDQRQQLLQEVINPDAFSYDMENDPVWGSYKKAAAREGERAVANALTQASVGTGGVPSSYAVTAATQAGNYYASQLGDMVPTLYQDAYNRYLNDYNLKMSALDAVNSDRALSYDEWLQKYNIMNNNLSIFQGLDETEYNRFLTTQQNAQDAQQQAYNNAVALYQILGYTTPEIAAILGIPEGSITQQSAEDAKQQAFSNALALYNTMGYATPEIAQILGIPEGSTIGTGTGTGTGNVVSGNYSGQNWDNEDLSEQEVTTLQEAINSLGGNLTVDGLYGNNSRNAVAQLMGEGVSARDAYNAITALGTIKQVYPDGVVDSQTWSDLLTAWDETTLKALGFSEASPGWADGLSTDMQSGKAQLKGSAWEWTKNNLKTLLRSGETQKAEAYMDQIVDQLSEEQYKELIALFNT